MKKPNIVLIVTDTHRTDALGCMGSGFAASPCIDRLASHGVLFENCHSVCPVCMPARSSLIRGVHPPIHGCIENGISPRTDLPVFTDALKERGYHTIMAGKTHFGPIPASFDTAHVFSGEKNSDVDDEYARFLAERGHRRGLTASGLLSEELHADAWIVDRTVQSIKDAAGSGNAPFFAFCSLPSPHSPLDPPVPWNTMYDSIDLPPLNLEADEWRRQPGHVNRLLGLGAYDAREQPTGDPDDRFLVEGHGVVTAGVTAGIERFRRQYYALAAYVDAQVGRVIAFLDESGLRDNTLVIFTSDHGQQNFDHGFNDKHVYYDETWRVPLVLSMPGTLPQGTRAGFASTIDVTATILAAAGAEMPGVQGFDLLSPLCGGTTPPRNCVAATIYKSAAIVTENWKLEYFFEDSETRLFDRISDPREQIDLSETIEYADVKQCLLTALLAWRGDICDVHALQSSSGGAGGPVARRLTDRTFAMRGADAEARLCRAVATV